MEIRNIQRTAVPNIFNCEYHHPQFGWIPFGACADDTEKLGRDIHAEIMSGKYEIAEYEPVDEK